MSDWQARADRATAEARTDPEAARVALAGLRAELAASGDTFGEAEVSARLWPLAERFADLIAWERARVRVERLARQGRASGGVAEAAERAARRAAEAADAGGPSRAARAWAVALEVHRSLGVAAAEARCAVALRHLREQGAMIPLDGVDLRAELGRGSMGVVWRGIHRSSGTVVAVKVLTAHGHRTPAFLSALHLELRAMAAMSHPSVATAREHGRLGPAAAVMCDLEEGSPYLVMDLARGSLAPQLGRLAWPTCAAVLRSLLGALAHAHAHGIVHRDVKPANVLVDRIGGGTIRVRLTDFGLAHSLDGSRAQAPAAGTPGYMAPEQLLGRWRGFGPWTDLYALGCLAAALVQGGPPARALDPLTLLHGQLARRGPLELSPRMAVPDGLDRWIGSLLEPDPDRRPRRAAEALRTLEALAPDRGRTRPRPARRIPGAGLGLVGVVEPACVGRDGEIRAAEHLLAAVERTARPRVLVLEGARGRGRSRLLREIGRRIAEAGRGVRVQLTGGDWRAMAIGQVRGQGLAAPELEARLSAVLGVSDAAARALGAQLTGRRRPDAARAAAVTLLARLAASGTVLLEVDDAHAHPQILEDLPVLLSGLAHPVLVLLTVCPEALPGAARAVLADLRDRPDTLGIALPPLDDGPMRTLLCTELGLALDLGAQVAARTEGNPGFAMELVGHWGRSGLLEQHEAGLDLAPDAQPVLAPSVRALVLRQVEEALWPGSPAGRVALELAAVLGREIELSEWEDACRLAALRVPPELVVRLVAAGLVRSTVQGFRFLHGLTVETLVADAAVHGRLVGHHQTCAAVLTRPHQTHRRREHQWAARARTVS